jgi:hypothetical protein
MVSAQAIIQVTAKASLLNLTTEIMIGRGDKAYIYLYHLRPPTRSQLIGIIARSPGRLGHDTLAEAPQLCGARSEAKMAAGCAKHFGSQEAAAAKKRAEFREAIATRL